MPRHQRPKQYRFPATPVEILSVLGLGASAAFLLTRMASSKQRQDPALPANSPDDEQRGRFARVPEQIPPRGLLDIFWRVVHEFTEDRISLIAAGVTFYLVLAVFPALAAVVSLYGFFAEPSSIADQLRLLSSILPPGAFDLMSTQLNGLAERTSSSLSLTFFIGLGVALWSSHNGIMALFDAMNIAYEEREKRGFIYLNVAALVFTLCGIVGAVVMIGFVAIMPLAFSFLWIDRWNENFALLMRWPILVVVAMATIGAIYRFGPSREPARARWLTWGAAFATIGWLLMSMTFSLYLQNFANYDVTYGTLGALIGFLIWLWLSVVILLVGAEINAEFEHQTTYDTTTGPPRPMGSRGAYVADTIGKASR
ncbi:MAG: YihY/virulence factor BrkB family protein [Allorhizobium sp.]